MTDTFTPPLNPSIDGTTEEFTAEVDEAKFGDGYEQRTPKGLNALDGESLSLTWAMLELAQGDEIIDFLRPKLKWEAFFWTPPGQDDPKKYKCTALRRRPLAGDLCAVGATFDRVFDL